MKAEKAQKREEFEKDLEKRIKEILDIRSEEELKRKFGEILDIHFGKLYKGGKGQFRYVRTEFKTKNDKRFFVLKICGASFPRNYPHKKVLNRIKERYKVITTSATHGTDEFKSTCMCFQNEIPLSDFNSTQESETIKKIIEIYRNLYTAYLEYLEFLSEGIIHK